MSVLHRNVLLGLPFVSFASDKDGVLKGTFYVYLHVNGSTTIYEHASYTCEILYTEIDEW